MPQVTILEGGKPKSFAGVDKLQIALSGGGTSLWVPKDTRLLTALTANVNGTYPPPDGYFGFDTVIVNVPPSQVAGIDPETGQYVLIGTKPSKPDDDDYPVWPTDPTVPDDPWDPDTDGGNGWDPYEVPDGGEWTTPWDDTDEDVPEIVKTHIPSGIKIVKLPNKTRYTDGEAMDYTGIRVQLLDENGQPFSNERYANTFIPFSELVFPVGIAYKSLIKDRHVVDGDTHFTFRMGDVGHVTRHYPDGSTKGLNTFIKNDVYVVGGGLKFNDQDGFGDEPVFKYGYNWGFFVADYRFVIETYEENGNLWAAHEPTGSEVINGKTVYYRSFDFYATTTPFESQYTTSQSDIVRLLFGGDTPISGNASIPVQWVSPYDGVTYEDTFHVTISESTDNTSDPDGGGGGFSGGGGEGTGGEGGGGGF